MAIGSPVARSLPNLFMEENEMTYILSENIPFKQNIEMWLRFIDNVFCLIRGEKEVAKFKEWVNELYHTIKFDFTHDCIFGHRNI